MNSSKRTSNIKTRLTSAIVVAALIICAVISFGFINIPRVGLADDDTSVKAVHGIRFAQVAAGEDFAIGLTSDGQLYGWSLLASRANETSFANPTLVDTLGKYYPGIPARLDVKFYVGPGRNDASPLFWSNDGYHVSNETTADEKIKTIVATRTTAAFVTTTGFIYTWGKDAERDSSIENVYYEERESYPHYLLLRNLDDNRDNWYQPYIINYNYYDRDTAEGGATSTGNPLNQLRPGSGGRDIKIAAGEFGYTVAFTHSSNTYVYTWGSLMYSVANTVDSPSETTGNFDHDYVQSGTNPEMKGGVTARNVFRLPAGTSVSSIAAGGYTVALNSGAGVEGGTSLMLRGRNFINSIDPEVSGSDVTAAKTSAIASGSGSSNAKYYHSGTEYLFTDAIAGGAINAKGDNGIISVTNANDLSKYYARQGFTSGTSIRYTAIYDIAIGSNGAAPSAGDSVSGPAYKAYRYDVSLGNDVGYGVTEDNKLYAWGDNKYGQLTSAVADDHSATPVSVLSGITTVAAGKQLSAFNKPLNNKADTLVQDGGVWKFNGDRVSGDATIQGVTNRPEFITGAVNTDGKLRVWNNVIKSPATLAYGVDGDGTSATVTESDKFVAVYSGYGNNLFAVTAIGKLVRVTYDAEANAFKQSRYDRFLDYTVSTDKTLIYSPVKNWDVNSENAISFAPTADPTKTKINPDYVPATVYVWSAVAAVGDGEDAATTGNVNGAFEPLVSVNNIGDAYRILTEADDDLLTASGGRKLLSPAVGDTPESFKPVFKFDGQVMSDKQQQNMFTYTYVTDANGKGITITPLQSSKGKVITVEFYIARYGNYADFSAASDAAQYYDYLPCSFTFKIADTPSVLLYDAYRPDADGAGNSNIPLLDPNNPHNSSYSLAVQDASGGFDALIRFLTGYSATGDIPTTNALKKAIVDFADGADIGFPAQRKISDGKLEYYLGDDAAAKYNNKYQFLFADRDSDRIMIDATGGITLSSSGGGASTSAVNYKKTPVTVTIDLSTDTYGIKPEFIDADTDFADINKKIATEFDNVYGLYDIAFNADKDALSFKYDIITFTATGTTGSIVYGAPKDATESTDNFGISSYVTTSLNPHVDVIVTAKTVVAYDKSYLSQYNANDPDTYVDIIPDDAVAGLFSQASLRLNKVKDPTGAHYGMSDGSKDSEHNRLTVTVTDTLYVGSSRTIKLSDYVEGSGSTGKIYFSYNNSTSKYNEFNAQFTDSSGGNRTVVKLEGTSLTVEPTVAAPLNIEVAVQRFATAQGAYFVAPSTTGSGYIPQEKIFITFVFGDVRGFTFDAAQGENASTSFVIKQPTTIDILAGGTIDGKSYNAFAAIKGLDADPAAKKKIEDGVSIVSVLTSAPTVFSVEASKTQPHSINITPLISGTGNVQVVATVYGESVIISFTVNVAYLTILGNNDLISLIDDEYVYIDALDTKLQDDNSFVDFTTDKYHIIYTDVKEQKDTAGKSMYNAIYFTTNPTDKTDSGYPEFIRSVTFESVDTQPYIRIEPSTSTVSDATTYYMHVRYTNMSLGDYESVTERGGSILEIVVPIASGKVAINLGDSAVTIDCKTGRPEGSSIWYTRGSKLKTVAVVSPKELLDFVGNVEATGDYRVFKVSAATEAAKYFNYRFNNSNQVEIIPLLNTPEGTAYALNVYVYNPREDANNTRVLTFNVEVKGILTVLPVSGDGKTIGYGEIWLYSFIIVFGILAIIFIIRLIVYWKKRAKQRAIIKRNQELIRLRDRMHNKASAATREQIVRTKLKMEDPRYAKIFNDMRKEKEEESGISLENSDLAATASKKVKKNKKKKGGKKTVAELKAELEAKRAAFASAQANAQPVNPFEAEVPIDGAAFVAPDGGYGDGGGEFVGPDGGFAQGGDFAAQDIGGDIVFDASDIGDGM